MDIDKLLNAVDVEPRPARPPNSITSTSTDAYHGRTPITHTDAPRAGENPKVKSEYNQGGEESEQTISSASLTSPTSQAPETPVVEADANSTTKEDTMPTMEETLEQAKRFKELYPAYKARHEELLARGTPLSEQERKEIGVMRGRLVGLKGTIESGAKQFAVVGTELEEMVVAD